MSALFVTALGAVLFALCFPVEAQQPKRVPRIGYLAGAADRKSPPVEAFRQGLRDLGYVEGKNIQVEFRYTEGRSDSTLKLLAELVQIKVDVLVIGQGQAAIRAAQQATQTFQIVVIPQWTRSRPGWSKAWRIRAEISPGLLQWLEN